jgi:hypothetical protein
MEKKDRSAMADALSLSASIRPFMDSEQPTEINPYESPVNQEGLAETAPSRPKLPLALTMVAWVTIVQGAVIAVAFIVSLISGGFFINLTILLIPAGIGLLRLRRGWRIFTLVLLWLDFIACPLALGFALLEETPMNLRLLGRRTGPLPDWMIMLGAVLLFLFTLWRYRVLIRWDVKALFGIHGKSVPRPDQM